MGDLPSNFRDIYVVIPAYNEVEVVCDVILDVSGYLPASQVIVVDDASTDQTAAAARQQGAVVLRHMINRGQGAALATGIAAALARGARAIITFDADRQHDAADIPAMLEPVLRGEAQVVLGSRFLGPAPPQMPPLRRIMLRGATLFTRLFSQIRVTDTHNGFRALSADAARVIRIRQDRMEHASEILEEIRRHGLRYVERPVNVRYSAYSLGKGQRNRDAIKILIKLLLNKVTG